MVSFQMLFVTVGLDRAAISQFFKTIPGNVPLLVPLQAASHRGPC